MLDFTPPPPRPSRPQRPRAATQRDYIRDLTAEVTPRRQSRINRSLPANSAARRKAKLSINIQFVRPEFRRLRTAARWLAAHVSLRQAIITAVIAVIIAASWAGLVIRKHQLDRQAAAHPLQSAANPGSSGTLNLPPFVPAVPGTEQQLLTPDGVHSKYDKDKQSYSYSDTIKGQQFVVSEQQLGGSLGTGQAAIDNVAKSLKATTAIKTGWGTAYVYTNPKYGTQTVVFGVRDLLGFIQASFKLDSSQWVSYINNLE